MNSINTTNADDTPALTIYRDDYDGTPPIADQIACLREHLDCSIIVRDGSRPTYRREGDGSLTPDDEITICRQGDTPPKPDGLPFDARPLLDAATDVLPLDWQLDDGSDCARMEATGEGLRFAITAIHGLVLNRAYYYADFSGAVYLTIDGTSIDPPLVDIDGREVELGRDSVPDAVRGLLDQMIETVRPKATDIVRRVQADIHALG